MAELEWRTRAARALCAAVTVAPAAATKPAAATDGSWSHVPLGPPDAILGLVEAFKADKSPSKVNTSKRNFKRQDAQPPPHTSNKIATSENELQTRFSSKSHQHQPQTQNKLQ